MQSLRPAEVPIVHMAPGHFLPSRQVLKRAALCVALAAGVAVAAGYGVEYWRVGRFQVTTDDAYVKADFTTVAPKISGYIAEVDVRDNQNVARGQVLARIDDRDFRVAVDAAHANVVAAAAAIRNLDAQLALQQSVIAQGGASVAASAAAVTFANQENARYRTLVATGAGTVQRAQQAAMTLLQTNANLQRDRAGLVAAQRQIDVLTSARVKAAAEADRALAAERQAALNLSYTVIRAAVSGSVGARSLRVGQYVQAGTQLMAVVPLEAVYVVANYKETQLTAVRAGQAARITVDGFPGLALQGHVDSIAPASGLEFALLPPDNATGNFTKIVQRVPVKIVLDESRYAGLLRAGMSVEPSIDTRGAR